MAFSSSSHTPISTQSTQTTLGSSSTQPNPVSSQPKPSGGNTPPPRVCGAPFEDALNKFRNRLTGTQLQDFKTATFAGLCDEILLIQEKQMKGNTMVNLQRIQSVLEAMQQFGKVTEIFLNVSNIVAYVWGPMKFLLLTASTATDSFETLLDAYEQIGEQLPLLSEYEDLFHQNPHMVNALELIYIDILEFHVQALKYFSGPLWTTFLKSMWKDFGTKFNGILKSLSRHKDLVECRATLSQYQLYRTDTAIFKAKLDAMIDQEQQKKLSTVKEWLAVGAQPQKDQNSFSQVRSEYNTTARWILKQEAIVPSLEPDVPNTPTLWMHGIPGAGKTILASAIVDECKSHADFVTSYFYCHEGDETSSTALSILKGLTDQLLDQYPDMLPVCHTRRTQSGDPILRSLAQAKKLLEEFCTSIPKVFIIVDGLDECEQIERKQALDILMEITSRCDASEPGKLRILFVSQEYADIRRALHSAAVSRMTPKTINISDADNEADIRTYTKSWVDEIAIKFKPFSADMQDYLRNLTIANAKGMFLYAKLVLQNLNASTTREELLDSIKKENFPSGLEAAYERILRRIKITSNPKEWNKAKKLLGWMVCAKRRLTWKEIQVAISIDTEDQIVDYDDRHLRTHIHDICGSLVILSGDHVSLVHSTAKKYITKVMTDIHEPSIECELATLCLQYLTFPCFDVDEPDNLDELQQFALEGQLAFQDYAIAKWSHHVNAWANSGLRFLTEASDQQNLLRGITVAIDDFMTRYSEEEWDTGLVEDCKIHCSVFEAYNIYDSLVLLTSHIYTFQKKGFEARHKISIKSLGKALERNRKVLEELPAKLTQSEKLTYRKFYDDERRFKCSRITCRYFSEGFKEEKARKRHVDIHNRPYQCEVTDCLGNEGFANAKDLEKHTRAFHPEISDLAVTFNSTTAKRAKADHACTLCGKTFTRNFHRKHHELSHRGERPHECSECGKAFKRLNDLKRHQKLHDRK